MARLPGRCGRCDSSPSLSACAISTRLARYTGFLRTALEYGLERGMEWLENFGRGAAIERAPHCGLVTRAPVRRKRVDLCDAVTLLAEPSRGSARLSARTIRRVDAHVLVAPPRAKWPKLDKALSCRVLRRSSVLTP